MADEAEIYRRSAEIVYDHNQKMFEFCLKIQAEYGKWLISSLLFLHGAAIGGLLFKAIGEHAPPYIHALWWFVFGIVLALAAGFRLGGISLLQQINTIVGQMFVC